MSQAMAYIFALVLFNPFLINDYKGLFSFGSVCLKDGYVGYEPRINIVHVIAKNASSNAYEHT